MSKDFIKIDQLKEELDAIFDDITGSCESALVVATKDMAKEAVKRLKADSPGKGRYAKGWTYTQSGDKYVVYNRTHGWLTHLLNNEHRVVVNGVTYGKREGDNHIGKVREAINNSAEDFVQEEIYKRLKE